MLGLQIYTVRSRTSSKEGCEQTLRKLKEIGYDCIQLAGGIDSIELVAEASAKTGLLAVGILSNIDTCDIEFDRVVKAARLCGARDVGVSGKTSTEAETREFAKRVNSVAKRYRDAGFSFSYHNHSHEFVRTECGLTVMDILLSEFDKELVNLMPDTYWLQHGGIDVRAFIEQHSGRIDILHVKDMKRTQEGVTFAEVGEGNLNMPGIIDVAKKIGVKDYIIEQDVCDIDCLLSSEISYNNLKKILNS